VNQRVFYTLNLAIFTSMLGMGIVIPFMPIYARTLGASGVTLGVFFASFSLAQMLFMPVIGRLSDRWGRKGFIAAGLVITSLISLWYVYAPSMVYLIMGRFVQGGALAMILPISTAYVGDLAPADKRGTYMGIFNLFLSSSVGIGPLIGGWLSDAYSMEASFYFMGGLNVLAFLFVLFFLPTAPGSAGSSAHGTSYWDLFRRPKVKGLALYRAANAIQMGLWFSFLPLLAAEILQLSKSRIGYVMAVYMLTSSLVQVPAGYLADRVSKRALIMVSSVLGSFVFATVVFAESFTHLLLIGSIIGIISALSMPALNALAADEGQSGGMGAVMAVLSVAMSAGFMIGPVVAGVLAEIYGLHSLFVFGAIVGLIGAVLFARWTVEEQTAAATTPEPAKSQVEVG
jgi:MFS transporter, DHA1 family, multidrug resistance protein